MGKPIIGIAANEVQDAGDVLHHLPIAYTPLGYVRAIQQAGGLPLLVPISEPAAAKDYVSQIDKLVLAGGQDVSPKFYGQEAHQATGSGFLARDEFELALIDEALLQKKPIFAVCRGMQLVNVAFGGTLQQDISTFSEIIHMQAPIPKEVPTHAIATAEKSMLARVYGQKTKVNSFHHQAVDRLARPLQKTAWSPDGIIEGIEHVGQRLLAVQWHPDFAYDALIQEQAVFKYVVDVL
ncbi:gamma-glutamyl-gamma-aminobutyrate hydrolase [Enterococcus casseliflavus]|nr:gamma-glutamyl-gamma-aminobutyrate hydrolase [Enterococcus casseliflavus]